MEQNVAKDLKNVNKNGEDVKRKGWREKKYRKLNKLIALAEEFNIANGVKRLLKEEQARNRRGDPEKKPLVKMYRLLEEKTNLKPGNAIHAQMADFLKLFDIKNEAGNMFNRQNVYNYLKRELSI